MNKLTSYKEEGKIRHIKNFKLQSYQEFDNFICNSLIQSKMGEKKKKEKRNGQDSSRRQSQKPSREIHVYE